MNFKSLIVIFCFLFSGCATTYLPQKIDIPSKKEFVDNCSDDLFTKYPDIEKYNKIFRWEYLGELPEMREVYTKLGKPDKSEFSLWNANQFIIMGLAFGPVIAVGVGSIFFFMQPVYVEEWNLENYVVKAYVQQPLVLGYDSRLWYFDWELSENSNCG